MLVLCVGSPKLVFLPQEGAAPELRPGPRSLRSRRLACSDPDQAAPGAAHPTQGGLQARDGGHSDRGEVRPHPFYVSA